MVLNSSVSQENRISSRVMNMFAKNEKHSLTIFWNCYSPQKVMNLLYIFLFKSSSPNFFHAINFLYSPYINPPQYNYGSWKLFLILLHDYLQRETKRTIHWMEVAAFQRIFKLSHPLGLLVSAFSAWSITRFW